MYGSVTLSSASQVTLSGVGAQDIAGQYDNTTSAADSLQASQTVAATGTFTAGTSGTINFNLGGAATATASINTTAADTATTVAQKINSTAALQQAGISASLNAQGNLVISNTSGQNLALTDSNAVGGFVSGLDNAQIVTGSAFTAGVAGDTLTLGVGSTSVKLTLTGATNATQLSALINGNSTLRAAGITTSVNGAVLVVTNTSGQALSATETGTLKSGLPAPASTAGTFATVTNQTQYNATASGSLANIDVLTVADSQHTIQAVDSALNQISTLQGQLGAVQNRFTSIISNLSASVQNAQSAQSSIQDTNYASETSALSRAQVLSQAAQAMVAQANQLPQQVLKLLQ
ncbi:flagellin [Paraburkholderia sp. RL17-337-BIB-A]|uniref:flagellin n=1 Tax=Paraburkholderia sp. RL17-337-BIB-A TaxID=3031636 RepID=UPI0038BDF6E8